MGPVVDVDDPLLRHHLLTFLVISNLWTLILIGRARMQAAVRRCAVPRKERGGYRASSLPSGKNSLRDGNLARCPLLAHRHPRVCACPKVGATRLQSLGGRWTLDAFEERLQLIRKSLAELD
jgi:hypothetical protein